MKSINRNVWIILGVVGVAMASPLWFRQLQRLQVRRAPSTAVSSARLAAVDMTPVNSGRSRPTPVSLALSGDLDMPASGATSVVVRVGAQQYPAVVSGDAFSANLPQVLQGANISIEATRGNLVYRALIGSAGLAKRQAGADGRLDASENPSLHVSPLSTAYHFFITRELGDRLPANDDEMDRALRSVYAPDIPVVANALDKIAKGTVVVPQLYANGLALIGDRQAFRRFLYDNAAAIGDPMTYLRQQPGNTFSLADLQKTWVLTGRMPFNRVAFQQPGAQVMLKTAAGVDLYSNRSRRNASFAPAIQADGDLLLQANGPVTFDVNELITPAGLSTVYTTARHTVASERYKRLFLGKRVALWLDTTDETVTWPAYPLETPKQSVGSVLLVAGELQAITVPVVSANVLGRRGYPTFCQESPLAPGLPVVLNECEFAEHFFGSNGTALAQGLGQKIDSSMNPVTTAGSSAVAWSIASDGSLRLQGAGYSVSMWRLGITEDVADAMIYIATSQDGADTLKLAGHTVVLDGNAPVAFAAADVVGKWKLGTFGDEHAPYAYNTNNGFSVDTFVRSADGTQSQDSYAGPLDDATDEFQTWHYRSGWKMVDSALYDTRYRANVPLSSMPANTTYFSSCQAAFALGATQCAPIRVRNFRPLAKVGNRWYGIENLYTRALITNYTPPFQIDRFTRATYHELQP